MSINVTKTYLPPVEEYMAILKRAWDNEWITNNGILAQELEQQLKNYLQKEFLLFCSNGTIALQLAIKALGITKEIITTPFSYVASTNSILWEGCKPVFVDINPDTFCIDASKIEEAITGCTEAILATHVYGLPCDVERIEEIANRHHLKVIYDGAHAFGCVYKGRSLLSYGDISTCSFHATKIFHTVEGGCIISNNKQINDTLFLYRSFGHIGDDYYSIGINAKNSEFHAAMGLAVLPRLASIIDARKRLFDLYNAVLPGSLRRPSNVINSFEYNYSYYPVIFESEELLFKTRGALAKNDINTRRYFYPSLNKLPHVANIKSHCPISEDISSRVLCLPLYADLSLVEMEKISSVILKSL